MDSLLCILRSPSRLTSPLMHLNLKRCRRRNALLNMSGDDTACPSASKARASGRKRGNDCPNARAAVLRGAEPSVSLSSNTRRPVGRQQGFATVPPPRSAQHEEAGYREPVCRQQFVSFGNSRVQNKTARCGKAAGCRRESDFVMTHERILEL